MNKCHFNVSDDILTHCLAFLDVREVARSGSVARQWHTASEKALTRNSSNLLVPYTNLRDYAKTHGLPFSDPERVKEIFENFLTQVGIGKSARFQCFFPAQKGFIRIELNHGRILPLGDEERMPDYEQCITIQPRNLPAMPEAAPVIAMNQNNMTNMENLRAFLFPGFRELFHQMGILSVGTMRDLSSQSEIRQLPIIDPNHRAYNTVEDLRSHMYSAAEKHLTSLNERQALRDRVVVTVVAFAAIAIFRAFRSRHS